MAKKFDTIIIGQGLAGSLLAYRLIQKGQKILVIDNHHHGSSSVVAAGIINPITGYRLINNILFSEQRRVSLALYKELEDLFTQCFVSELKQYRLLQSEEQAQFCNARQAQSNYKDYLGERFAELPPLVNKAWGILEIHKTLRIHTAELLIALKSWLVLKQAYKNQKLDYAAITMSESGIEIDGVKSRNIIFCEGFQVIHNPWWKHLPFKLSKGEILKVELNQEITGMLNWQQWLVPEKGSQALLGTNYQWDDFSTENALHTSDEAREYLSASLNKNTHLRGKILEQQAGIRPTPTHRHPYIGQHKAFKNIYCFNGFGSKGCLTIPYYSDNLVNHLLNNTPLPKDVTRWL